MDQNHARHAEALKHRPDRLRLRLAYGLLLGLSLLGLVGGLSPAAYGYVVAPPVEQNMGAIAQHTTRGGAVSPSGYSCLPTCSDLWLSEHRPMPNQASSEALHRELRSLRVKTGTLPKLRYISQCRFGGFCPIALGTFAAGWMIGDTLNRKFLKLGLPEEVPHTNTDFRGNGRQQQLLFNPAGFDPYFGYVIQPRDGFTWQRDTDSGLYSYWRTGTPESGCDHNRVAPPVGLTTVITPYFGHNCGYAPDRATDYKLAYIPENDLPANGPIEDYSGQPSDYQTSDWPEKPTTQTQVETAVSQALRNGEVPLAEAFYAAELDPRNYDTATDRDEQCELDGGGTDDPGRGRGSGESGVELQRRYEQAPDVEWPTAGVNSINGPVYLRWGVAFPNVDNSHIEWSGWGYRKIKAKHGWGPESRAATQNALLDAAPTKDTRPAYFGRYTYRGPEYGGRSNALCRRVVVVEHEPREVEINNGFPAASMITSYGERVN